MCAPPPSGSKYVTPHGTGDHSGSSWSNAYSLQEMRTNLASNTFYFLTDSTLLVEDKILISELNNIAFVGIGIKKTFLEGISGALSPDTSDWSIECFDLFNSDNITIKNMQIRRFRGYGIRVDAASSYFYGYKLYVDSCGWAAWGNSTEQEIAAPSGVKLLGDDATFRQSYIMQSGWDALQVAGYRILIDLTTIYAAGVDPAFDDPNLVEYQGDGIGAVVNQDSFYYVNINGTPELVYKSAQFTVTSCNINTDNVRKSGIEAGAKPPEKHSEKPLVQVYDSYIAGGKGIGITQDANPRIGHFYSTIINCTIADINPLRYPIRIEEWDGGSLGEISDNLCLCPSNYPNGLCPVGEYDTDHNNINYGLNKWKKGDTFFDWCVDENLIYFED